jgi:hypothetical protein
MIAAPESCVSTILGFDRRADVGDVDEARDAHPAGLGVDLELDPVPRPSRRRGVIGEAVLVRRLVARDILAVPTTLPACMPYFFLKISLTRGIRRKLQFATQVLPFSLRVLGRELHRVAHVEERARAERSPCRTA